MSKLYNLFCEDKCNDQTVWMRMLILAKRFTSGINLIPLSKMLEHYLSTNTIYLIQAYLIEMKENSSTAF